MPTMDFAETFGDKPIYRVAESLPLRAAKDFFRSGIEDHNSLILVERNDGVHRRTDDFGETIFAAEQIFFALGQRFFRDFSAGSILINEPAHCAHGKAEE